MCVHVFFDIPSKGLNVNKVYPDAATALHDVVANDQLIAVGGLAFAAFQRP
jgi:hypothetical protein